MPIFSTIDGGRTARVPATRIAMSLVVYERKRLDIPLHAMTRIEPHATQTFLFEGGGVRTYDMPHVQIWLTPNLQAKLRAFTKDIVGEIMELHVAHKVVARPVLREPLGNEPAFQISAYDLTEAQALAARLANGWRSVHAVE